MSEKKTNDDLVANTPDEDISDVDSEIDSDIDNNSDSENEINEDNDNDDEEDNEDENEDDDEDEKEKEVKSVTDVVPSLANDDIINTDNQSLGLLEDSSDDEDETLYEKFDDEMRERVIEEFHPELQSHNYSEITVLTKTVRNSDGIIVDELHQTTPIMSKFEYTRILGMREKQLNDGAKPFIKINDGIIDSYVIAKQELQQKRLPFIIKRPMPNGGCEYWKITDLEILHE